MSNHTPLAAARGGSLHWVTVFDEFCPTNKSHCDGRFVVVLNVLSSDERERALPGTSSLESDLHAQRQSVDAGVAFALHLRAGGAIPLVQSQDHH
jgi:hypothetical protein